MKSTLTILSHDAQSGELRIRLQYGFHLRVNESHPSGWRGDAAPTSRNKTEQRRLSISPVRLD